MNVYTKTKHALLQHVSTIASASAVASMVLVGAANAALPAAVGTTITGIQTDGQALFDLVFPVIGVFLGLGIIITLFKRFSKKV